MQLVHTLIAKAARTIMLSVSGETGTGKGLMAEAIHFQLSRSGQSLVTTNMTTIPRELVERELFGHEKNAFLRAVARRVGRQEIANGGILFLDEIAGFDLSLQTKLLRMLWAREVTRVTNNQGRAFGVRLIMTTHCDLLAEVQADCFRDDLYYRLLGLPITLPPLRQRDNDMLLAEVFVRDFCILNNLPTRQLVGCARIRLSEHYFPNNMLQIKVMLKLATVLVNGGQIRGKDQPLRLCCTLTGSDNQLSLRDQTTTIVQQCLNETGSDVLAVTAYLHIGKSTIYCMIQQQELTVGPA